MFRSFVSRLGRAVRVVIHDPAVERSARGLAVLVAVRVLIAMGASAQLVELVRALVAG